MSVRIKRFNTYTHVYADTLYTIYLSKNAYMHCMQLYTHSHTHHTYTYIVFLSRNKLREISSGARNGTVSTQVPITLTKIPTETGAVEEGEKLVAKGSMDLSTITDAGVTSVSFYCR